MGERKYTFLKFFAYVIEIIIFYILEGVPNLFPEVLQGKPLFLLPIALSIGFFEKEISAMVTNRIALAADNTDFNRSIFPNTS